MKKDLYKASEIKIKSSKTVHLAKRIMMTSGELFLVVFMFYNNFAIISYNELIIRV